jgi:hypothetical protein
MVQSGAETTVTFLYALICLIAREHWNETHQFYVHRMQFYYSWWITSWRWPPGLKSALSKTINKIIKNPMQQILELIHGSNFILNCTFQVLCGVGVSSVYSFFQISAQKKVWYRDVRQTCWPRDVSKTWNNLMDEIADHVHVTVWLSCKICPKLLLLMPTMRDVAELSDVDYDEMIPLLCKHFSMHNSWSTMKTVSYTASVFKLMHSQQNPVVWRNCTMPRNNELLPQVTLYPNDGLCFVIKTRSCSSVSYTPPPHCD